MGKFASKKRGTRKTGRKRKASSPETTILDIPEHLLVTILRKCPLATLLQASAVCKQFHSLCTSDTLWKPLYEDLLFTVGLVSVRRGSQNEEDFAHSISGPLHISSEQEDSEGANTYYDLSRLKFTKPFMERYKNVLKQYELNTHLTNDDRWYEGSRRTYRPSSSSASLGLRKIPYSRYRNGSMFDSLIFIMTFEEIFRSSICKARGRVPVRRGYREHEVVNAGHLAKVRQLRNPWLTLARRNR